MARRGVRRVNAQLLDLQLHLQRKMGLDPLTMTDEERVEYVRINILAAIKELGEALDEVSWKPWASGEWFNREAFLKELIDVAHFFNNLWLVGTRSEPVIAADTLNTLYTEKNRVNADRQDHGYDGVSSKCPHCRRALDDGGLLEATGSDGERLLYCRCGFVIHLEESRA